jgi:hypothetical protein
VLVDARNVDDQPAVLPHRARRRLSREERRPHVDREDRVEVLRGQLERRLRDRDPGVVDEDVQPPELARNLTNNPRRDLRVGEVADDGVDPPSLREPPSDLVLRLVRREAERVAVGDQALSDCEPDA